MTGPLDNITALQEALDELLSAETQLAGIPDWMEELHGEHSVVKAEIDELEAVVDEARHCASGSASLQLVTVMTSWSGSEAKPFESVTTSCTV